MLVPSLIPPGLLTSNPMMLPQIDDQAGRPSLPFRTCAVTPEVHIRPIGSGWKKVPGVGVLRTEHELAGKPFFRQSPPPSVPSRP
jgi:hypothetical protein